ncbi:protein LURP-one-related 8 [Arachis duranensis]|uniref:Protein LURP-one-related 8 n=1 Tax=Arachis duranensis TaxID=130453 RepID=A0A6P4DGZ7_ARADU|nr:protein LURP-one-related 8 [Arachis duranensis]
MRVFPRLRSLSRAVHQEQVEQEKERNNNDEYPVIKIQEEGTLKSTCLTVWRKSLVMNCKGFTVIDSHGNLVYRVDNYIHNPNEVVLMDASGNSVLTICRRTKKLGFGHSWYVYEGEGRESPICCVKKHVNILQGNPKVQAYVYRRHKPCVAAFTVEGSYAQRTCKVLDECGSEVAQIKRKEANTKNVNVSFGMDIFQLLVHPGFDPAFAMALVLLLDQMFS